MALHIKPNTWNKTRKSAGRYTVYSQIVPRYRQSAGYFVQIRNVKFSSKFGAYSSKPRVHTVCTTCPSRDTSWNGAVNHELIWNSRCENRHVRRFGWHDICFEIRTSSEFYVFVSYRMNIIRQVWWCPLTNLRFLGFICGSGRLSVFPILWFFVCYINACEPTHYSMLNIRLGGIINCWMFSIYLFTLFD